jgi:hypothetical protein
LLTLCVAVRHAALLREPEPSDREALVDFTAAEYALRARLAEPAPERCESCEQTGDSVRYRVDRDVPLCDDCVVALDESEPAPEPSAPAPAPSENCDCAPVADALNSWCREAHVAETPSAKWQDVRAAVYRLWDKLGSSRPATQQRLDREAQDFGEGFYVCVKCWKVSPVPRVCFCGCLANDGKTIVEVTKADILARLEADRGK